MTPEDQRAYWGTRCATCRHYAETAGVGIGTGRCALRGGGTSEADTCQDHAA